MSIWLDRVCLLIIDGCGFIGYGYKIIILIVFNIIIYGFCLFLLVFLNYYILLFEKLSLK